jgi:hypothetical protein
MQISGPFEVASPKGKGAYHVFGAMQGSRAGPSTERMADEPCVIPLYNCVAEQPMEESAVSTVWLACHIRTPPHPSVEV